MSRFYWIFTLTCLALGGTWWWRAEPAPGPSPTEPKDFSKVVEVQSAQHSSIERKVRLTGTLRSHQQTTLRSRSKGTLEVVVQPGQRLQPLAPIARIMDPALEDTYALLQETQALAKEQLERAQRLSSTGSLSKQMVEDKALALFEAQKQLAEVQQKLETLRIEAPFEGIVGVFKQRSGAMVKENEELAVFYNPDKLFIEVDVPLPVARLLESGTPVHFQGNTYSLTHIQKFLDENTHMCPATVNVQAPEAIIGSTVSVEFIVEERSDVIVVPFEAVFFREGKAFVYVIEDATALPRAIELGIRDKEHVEVTQGLEAGTVFIRTAPDRIYPHSPVRIAQA